MYYASIGFKIVIVSGSNETSESAKLTYQSKNLQDWCDYHGIKGFKFPSSFPLRTVLPMRVLLANDKAATDCKLYSVSCL